MLQRRVRPSHGLESAYANRDHHACLQGLASSRSSTSRNSYYAPVLRLHGRHVRLHSSLHRGARSSTTSSACSSIPRSRARSACRIVRNFVELVMLAKRIIPCLDVTGGRVVKGVNFVNLRDAGDPVELAERYNAARRRRAGLSRHHRFERCARDHGGCGGAHRAQGFHPAHGGRRHPQCRRCAQHSACPARTKSA